MKSAMKSVMHAAIAACIVVPLSAQNAVTNGDFAAGMSGWTLVSFNDPIGTTGIRMADVNGDTDTSSALYADFQTLTPVMSATYSNTPFTIAAGTYPFTIDISWEKQVTTPIPSASVNRVEIRLYDNNSSPPTMLTSQRQTVPNQTGLIERASYQGTFAIPSSGSYYIEVFMRHSNLAGIPFICNVDDIAFGEYGATVHGSGSARVGGTTTFNLSAPAAANKPYQVASAFSTGPIPVGGRSMDLRPDALFSLSVGGALPNTFFGYAGNLDGSGNGTAQLRIPPVAAIVGNPIHTAFVTIDAGSPNNLQTISNTWSFTIQP